LLNGTALAWAQRYYEYQDPVLQSFPAFTALFKQTFDDPGRIAESARKIRYISQGTKDISDYVAQFQLLASDLDYNDQAFLALFKGGLAMEINTLLFNRNIQSATLAELIANSISTPSLVLMLSENSRQTIQPNMQCLLPLESLHALMMEWIWMPWNLIALPLLDQSPDFKKTNENAVCD
jgi:hypothetical protein